MTAWFHLYEAWKSSHSHKDNRIEVSRCRGNVGIGNYCWMTILSILRYEKSSGLTKYGNTKYTMYTTKLYPKVIMMINFMLCVLYHDNKIGGEVAGICLIFIFSGGLVYSSLYNLYSQSSNWFLQK